MPMCCSSPPPPPPPLVTPPHSSPSCSSSSFSSSSSSAPSSSSSSSLFMNTPLPRFLPFSPPLSLSPSPPPLTFLPHLPPPPPPLQCGPARSSRPSHCNSSPKHQGTVRKAVMSLVGVGLVCVPLWIEPASIAGAASDPQVAIAKASSVESILARQLARRFREMSDEELADVLEQLLRASKSFTVLSGARPVPGQESLDQEVATGLRKRSSTRASRSEVEGERTEAGEAPHPDSPATTSDREVAQGKETQAGNEWAHSPSTKDVASPRISQDRGVSGSAAGDGKDVGDERDLTVLLWKEFQRRVDASSGARERADLGANDSSLSRVNTDWQGLFRDPKVVALGIGVLALNAGLTVGQWRFLDVKTKIEPANVAQNAGRNAASSDLLSKTSDKIKKKSDQNSGVLRSFSTIMGGIFDQVRDIGKKTDRQEGKGLGNDNVQNLGSEQWSSRTSSSSKEDIPFSAKLASIRKVSSERKSQEASDASSVLQKRISGAPEKYKEDFQLQSAKHNLNERDVEVMSGRDSYLDSVPLPSIQTYTSSMEVENGSRRYGRGRLAGEIISFDEQDWGEGYLPASLVHDKNLRVSEEASISSRSSLKSPAGKKLDGSFQGPGDIKEDFRLRVSGSNQLKQKREVDKDDMNKPWFNGDGLTSLEIKTGYGDYAELTNERINTVKGETKDSGKFKRAEVDYWADSAESAGYSRVINKPDHKLGKSGDIYEEILTDAVEDQFMHNGALWTRDLDGVFVKQATNSIDSLSAQNIADRKSDMKAEVAGLENSLGDGHLHSITGGSRKTRKGVFFRNRGQILDGPSFDYRQLVLQQETNDLTLEKLGSNQSNSTVSLRPSVHEMGVLQGEQHPPVFNEVRKSRKSDLIM